MGVKVVDKGHGETIDDDANGEPLLAADAMNLGVEFIKTGESLSDSIEVPSVRSYGVQRREFHFNSQRLPQYESYTEPSA